MKTDELVSFVRRLMTEVMNWARGIAAVIAALMVLSTLLFMAGHPIPYIPTIKADMYQFGVFIAACKYALWS